MSQFLRVFLPTHCPTAIVNYLFSLSNITATRLPYKSQRRALLKKIQKDYGNPTAWPDTILEKISGLVDDMDMYEISLFRKDYVSTTVLIKLGSLGSFRVSLKIEFR